MINLIPPKAKKTLVAEYWVRVVSVWGVTWAFTLISCACILFPAYILIDTQVEVYDQTAQMVSEKVTGYEATSVALVQASQQAKAIIDLQNEPRLSQLIAMFNQHQTESVTFSSIKLNRGGKGLSPVTLVGKAQDRHALAKFKESLSEAPEVSGVDLPISNLAQEKDLLFTITVTLNQDKI